MPLKIYETLNQNDDLQQGDLVFPENEIKSLINQNGAIIESDIIAFIVITQSCDLVSRDNSVKTDYINFAIVKDFEIILQHILNNLNKKIIDNVYFEKEKSKNTELVQRIINQNEKDLGLFYLYPDLDKTQIADHSVALLRNNFSINSKHYEVIKKHRFGRIQPEFQHKLGWIVGYLYSRVGTHDWSEDAVLKNEMTQIIQSLLNNDKYKWIEQEKFKNASNNGLDINGITFDNVHDKINELQPDPPRKAILKVIQDKANAIILKNNDAVKKFIQNSFDNLVRTKLNEESEKYNEEIIALIKSSNEIIMKEVLRINNTFSNELMTKLSNDPLYTAPFKKPLY